ncbi:efflux RND transporter permease subunit [Shigella flexneri]
MLIIAVGTAYPFVRLPVRQMRTRAVSMTMVQLPAGATQERTQKVLNEVNQLRSDQRKEQRRARCSPLRLRLCGTWSDTGIAFVSSKDWGALSGEENKVEAITMRAIRRFLQIKDAMVFAFNLPAIVEPGTATGFDFSRSTSWPWS